MPQTIVASGVTLPSPVKIESSKEIIWSSNTNRNTAGNTIGTVITQKRTVDLEWNNLTAAEVSRIESAMPAGFFQFQFYDSGNVTMTVYRGALKKVHMGYVGDGSYYYKSVSVTLIEK